MLFVDDDHAQVRQRREDRGAGAHDHVRHHRRDLLPDAMPLGRRQAAVQDGDVFTVVEQQPEYSGGYNKMMDFLFENLRYPEDARSQGIEGTVYVSFIVETDGAVTNVKIIRGLGASVDQEAKRVVELFPNWQPGKQGGQAVRVKFVLPIKFKLG